MKIGKVGTYILSAILSVTLVFNVLALIDLFVSGDSSIAVVLGSDGGSGNASGENGTDAPAAPGNGGGSTPVVVGSDGGTGDVSGEGGTDTPSAPGSGGDPTPAPTPVPTLVDPQPDAENKDVDFAGITVSSQKYTGSELTPKVTVVLNGKLLVEGTDYDIEYRDNIDAGQACVIITGKGDFNGTRTEYFTIKKAAGSIKATAKKASIKASALKKKKKTVTLISVKEWNGSLSFKKISGSNKLNVDRSTGKVTIKKGTKKGDYTVKIRITASGGANHDKAEKTVTCRVSIK